MLGRIKAGSNSLCAVLWVIKIQIILFNANVYIEFLHFQSIIMEKH